MQYYNGVFLHNLIEWWKTKILFCAVQENTHTHTPTPQKGLKFPEGGGGGRNTKDLKKCTKL